MTTGRQRKIMKRKGPDGEEVRVGAEDLAKPKNVFDAASAVSRALRLEGDSPFQRLQVDMRDYDMFKNSSFSELEKLHDAETGFVLHKKMILTLLFSPKSSGTMLDQTSSALSVFCKKTKENA